MDYKGISLQFISFAICHLAIALKANTINFILYIFVEDSLKKFEVIWSAYLLGDIFSLFNV